MHILILERQPTTEHDIEDHTRTPDIDFGASVDGPTDDFRCGIVRAPATRAEKVSIANNAGQPKVAYLHVELIVEQNILWLEVAMDDFETVRVFNTGYELLEKAACLGFWHAAIGNDVVEELSTGIFEDEDDICRC